MAVKFYINMCVCAFKEKSSILIISVKEQAASITSGMRLAVMFIEDGTVILSLYVQNLFKTKILSLNRQGGQYHKT